MVLVQFWTVILVSLPLCVYLWYVQTLTSGWIHLAGFLFALLYTFTTLIAASVYTSAIAKKIRS